MSLSGNAKRRHHAGLTPLGTQLDQKIIQPLLLGPIRQNALKKPVLIIVSVQ